MLFLLFPKTVSAVSKRSVRRIIAIVGVAVVVSFLIATWALAGRYTQNKLSAAELAPKQGVIRAPSIEDCSEPRLAYERLNRSSRVLDKKPPHNSGILTEDEIAIYRLIIDQWIGKKGALNVAQQTFPVEVSIDENMSCECLRGFDAQTLFLATHSFHKLTWAVLREQNIRIVSVTDQRNKIARNDPERLIEAGKSINEAVTIAEENGLFSLSEIVFDRTRQRALVSYSFQCGMLCGSGATLIFEKTSFGWKRSKIDCGGWVS